MTMGAAALSLISTECNYLPVGSGRSVEAKPDVQQVMLASSEHRGRAGATKAALRLRSAI